MISKIKGKMQRGEVVVAVNLGGRNPDIIEHLARPGADPAFIDCERTGIGLEAATDLIRAARARRKQARRSRMSPRACATPAAPSACRRAATRSPGFRALGATFLHYPVEWLLERGFKDQERALAGWFMPAAPVAVAWRRMMFAAPPVLDKTHLAAFHRHFQSPAATALE